MGDRQHRKQVRRQVKYITGSGKGGSRCKTPRTPFQTRAATRAALAIAAAYQAGGDEVAFKTEDPRVTRRRRILCWITDRVPDLLATERLLDQNLGQNQSRERVAASSDFYLTQLA